MDVSRLALLTERVYYSTDFSFNTFFFFHILTCIMFKAPKMVDDFYDSINVCIRWQHNPDLVFAVSPSSDTIDSVKSKVCAIIPNDEYWGNERSFLSSYLDSAVGAVSNGEQEHSTHLPGTSFGQ